MESSDNGHIVWNDIDEKKPEEDQVVIVIDKYGDVHNIHWNNRYCCSIYYEDVLYWIPMFYGPKLVHLNMDKDRG